MSCWYNPATFGTQKPDLYWDLLTEHR